MKKTFTYGVHQFVMGLFYMGGRWSITVINSGNGEYQDITANIPNEVSHVAVALREAEKRAEIWADSYAKGDVDVREFAATIGFKATDAK